MFATYQIRLADPNIAGWAFGVVTYLEEAPSLLPT